MAPGLVLATKLGRARRTGKRKIRRAALRLLLLDILDHLGHVVLVLAEFGCVLEQLLVLLFGLLERRGLLLLFFLGDFCFVRFELRIELVRADRRELLLDWSRRTRSTRFQKGLGIKG